MFTLIYRVCRDELAGFDKSQTLDMNTTPLMALEERLAKLGMDPAPQSRFCRVCCTYVELSYWPEHEISEGQSCPSAELRLNGDGPPPAGVPWWKRSRYDNIKLWTP